MEPAPFLVSGFLVGMITTLLVQAYGRRKARQAEARIIASQPPVEIEADRSQQHVERLAQRVAVLERIATEQPRMLADQIEALR